MKRVYDYRIGINGRSFFVKESDIRYKPGPYTMPPEVRSPEDWSRLPTSERYSDCVNCKKRWADHTKTGECRHADIPSFPVEILLKSP